MEKPDHHPKHSHWNANDVSTTETIDTIEIGPSNDSSVPYDTSAAPLDTLKSQYSSLNLSGKVISATICIPGRAKYRQGRSWEVSPRGGTSALFDALTYLSSPSSHWDHTVVAWTGEIEKEIPSRNGQFQQDKTAADGMLPRTDSIPLNKASAPVPVKGESVFDFPKPDNKLRLNKEDRSSLERQLGQDSDGHIVPVWLYDESEEGKDEIVFDDQSRWRRYAEHDVYTLFHYKQHEPTDGRAEKARWLDYVRLNQAFADRICSLYKNGDIVWVHDYHLLLLPAMLRQRIPKMYIGLFLHIPFPSSEFLRCSPKRKEILSGMLGANMIAFQTFSYTRHFSSCCTRILGYSSLPAGVDAYGAHIAIDVLPIGINTQNVVRAAFMRPEVEETIVKIKKQYPGQKIIIGRDRLDTVKGVAQKLQAFEFFLERHPEWIGKVVLIQVTSPTSIIEEKEESAQKITKKISELVSHINGTYGGLEYQPVYYFPQYLDRNEYFALLRIADVGLITSVRDGMSTASLEYVVCQKENYSPLILSEFSGTAASLKEAFHINPWNLVGTADTIHAALVMDAKAKKKQHDLLYDHVTTFTAQAWAQVFLQRLLVNLSSFSQSVVTPLLDRGLLLEKYQSAENRLFMFDYDGTLTPIVSDPNAATPSDRVIRTIKALTKDPRNRVWIISGRDQAFLEEWMGHISLLGLSAEHGSFMRHPGSDQWENLTEKLDMTWRKEAIKIFQHYTERTQGSFIEKKQIAITWHYRRADPEYGAYQARECKEHLERTVARRWPVEVMNGKANLEVRPRFVNKGEIAARLVRDSPDEGGSGAGEPDFVFCAGDDFTDEDMFRSLRNSTLPKDKVFACTVGASSKQTLASWHVLEPTDIISTVVTLNSGKETPDSGS